MRLRPASSASRSISSRRRSNAAGCVGIPRSGWGRRDEADLRHAQGRCRDRGANRDPRCVAAVDRTRPRPEVPAALDDPRPVQGHVALLGVRHARRSEPRAHRPRLRDRRRRRDRARDPDRPVALGAALDDAAHRVLARDAAARTAPDLDRPAPFDREPPEGLLHRVLLSLPGAPEHDRRRPRDRPDADRHGPFVRRAAAGADRPHRPARGASTDRRGDAEQPLARRDHDGALRVLLEHERSGVRPADLEEHLPARADVGGDPPDRAPRLSAQRPLPPRRAAAPRMAPRLARIGACLMLEIKHLGKTYGTGAKATHAIGDVSFTVTDGEFVCVVGPSGCGKTTLLKCVAGLLRSTRGDVLLRGQRVAAPPEELALVFQEYSRSLMPWASVRNNVLLPLRHKKLPRSERSRLVEESLDPVELPRPRDQIATKELPEFAHLRGHVYRLIKREQVSTPDAEAPSSLVPG